MQKFFGIVFLAASVASGVTAWRVWREMGEHSTSVLIVLILGFSCFLCLVIGVGFMRGLYPAKRIWQNFISDAD